MTPRDATDRIGGVWRDGRGVGPCPLLNHGRGRGDLNWSLSLGAGADADLVVHCFAGCDPRDVLAALRNLSPRGTGPAVNQPHLQSRTNQVAGPTALDMWNSALPIAGTVADTYLSNRGLTAISQTLRFLPDAWHAPSAQRHPAMLARLQDTRGEMLAVQRTFLATGGHKADVNPTRMMLGSLKAGAVQLAPAVERLGLAEGVESALAASAIHSIPCWAACGARLHRVALPGDIRQVILFADNDPSGLQTAERAFRRFRTEGRRVEIRTPEREGADWNDVLLARAKA
jgi:putative DNA primase/helicase